MSHEPTRHANTRIFPAALDPDAVKVVERLTSGGFESYLVGGCVRDLLMGMIPKDFDVSTAARPRQVRRLFRNCRVIGRRFKLAHVHFGDKIIEVSTFRRPPESEDEGGDTDAAEDARGRVSGPDGDEHEEHGDDGPEQDEDLLITRDNEFGTAEEDVIRRDFTINALLYDVGTDEVIDYVGGVDDVNDKVLRTIGDPAVRLAEDPVRMLRAIKFTARAELTLEPGLDRAMRDCAELITRSAPPRVLEEIFKLLACGGAKRSLPMLVEFGLLDHLLPEIAPYWNEHREELAAVGAALDLMDAGQRSLRNGFLLAALYHGPWRAALEADGGDATAAARDLIQPAALRMSIARRDVAMCKQLLVTQLRLQRSRRSRRLRMGEFLARTSTRDAIQLLYLTCLAGQGDDEVHARWAHRLALRELELGLDPDGSRSRDGDDGEGEDEGGPRKRRRRRRSRSRRGRGRDDDARGDDQDDREPAGEDGAARSREGAAEDAGGSGSDGEGRRKRRRRRGGRGRGRRSGEGRDEGADEAPADASGATEAAASRESADRAEPATETASATPAAGRRRRTRATAPAEASAADSSPAPDTRDSTGSDTTGADDTAGADERPRGLRGFVAQLFRKVKGEESTTGSSPPPQGLSEAPGDAPEPQRADATAASATADPEQEDDSADDASSSGRRSTRSRGGRSRGGRRGGRASAGKDQDAAATTADDTDAATDGDSGSEDGNRSSRRRRRGRGGRGRGASGGSTGDGDREASSEDDESSKSSGEGKGGRGRSRRSRSGRGQGRGGGSGKGGGRGSRGGRSGSGSGSGRTDSGRGKSGSGGKGGGSSRRKSTKEEPASTGQRHPEDVEDIFDW